MEGGRSRTIGRAAVGVLLAVHLVVAPAGAARSAPGPEDDGARLVFLLEYVGTDYARAVRDGAVIDEVEYGEMLRFTKELVRAYAARSGRSDAVATGLRDLAQRVERRAPPDEVFAESRRLLPGLARAVAAASAPRALPNVAAGRRLWASDCAPCHGASGGGDGPYASGMMPPPTAFRGATLDRLSPRQIYHTLSFGIAGTAMPAFSLAYTERQRWDVAFYVMTLRVDFDPQRPRSEVRFDLAELASASNAELLARLRQRDPAAGAGEVDWLRINFAGASAGAAGPLVGAPAGLGAALQMQQAFASVAERVLPRVVGLTAYARDPAWTLESLRTRHGDGWMAENPDATRYPGFRPVRAGSGVIVDEQGYLLSCDHLVRDDQGEVVAFVDAELQDQTHVAARVVGAEPALDLAIVQLADTSRLGVAAAELDAGDSDHLQLGQWLIALGDPPGPGKTFAVGIVSAPPQRQCYQAELSATRVQSSLVVPAGGLCGPVVDIFGHVVGLSVQQAAPTGVVAPADGPTPTHVLPINLVLNLYEALRVAQSRRSPWIGVSVLELALFRQRLGARATTTAIPATGLYIDDVFDPSPAARAGIRPGDFLLALAEHPLLSVGDFQTWLYVLGVGREIAVDLQRDGKPFRLQLAIDVRPENATTR